MLPARTLDIIILAALLLVAVRLVPSAWNVIRIYTGVRTRRLQDASSFAPPAPPAVATMAQRLAALGFNRIGERSAVLPGEQRRFEWNAADGPTTTYVALVPSANMPNGVYAVFYSAFADGA